MELELQIVSRASVTVVRCHGRLVYGPEVDGFVQTLRQLLNTSKQIVLELAEVTQIDSGGLGALGAVFRAAHNREGEVKLASLCPRVEEVLHITNLGWLFDTHSSENDAIEAFLTPAKIAAGS